MIERSLTLHEAVTARRNATADPANGLTLRRVLELIKHEVLNCAAQLNLPTRRRSGGPSTLELLESSVQEVLYAYMRSRLVTGLRPGDTQPTPVSVEWLENAQFDIGANSADANGVRLSGIRVFEAVIAPIAVQNKVTASRARHASKADVRSTVQCYVDSERTRGTDTSTKRLWEFVKAELPGATRDQATVELRAIEGETKRRGRPRKKNPR